MGELTHADLLQMQAQITTAHREDIKDLKDDLKEHLAEKVSAVQDDVREVRVELADERTERRQQNADLRQLVEERTGGWVLTKAQKGALWTLATTALAWIGSKVAALFSLVVWVVKGAPRL